MPTIMHTSQDVDQLFKQNLEKMGLDPESPPTAVMMSLNALNAGVLSPFMRLIEELPVATRGFDWLSAAFAAYAEFFSHTVVVDTEAPAAE